MFYQPNPSSGRHDTPLAEDKQGGGLQSPRPFQATGLRPFKDVVKVLWAHVGGSRHPGLFTSIPEFGFHVEKNYCTD